MHEIKKSLDKKKGCGIFYVCFNLFTPLQRRHEVNSETKKNLNAFDKCEDPSVSSHQLSLCLNDC